MLDQPVGQVWVILRDFNGLPDWHPIVVESRIEQNHAADQVGCIRNFVLSDGGRLREQLLALSDYEFSCTYSILESPMPLSNYVATLRALPVTDGDRTYVEWTATFDCAEADEAGLISSIGQGVFQLGFDALKRRAGHPA